MNDMDCEKMDQVNTEFESKCVVKEDFVQLDENLNQSKQTSEDLNKVADQLDVEENDRNEDENAVYRLSLDTIPIEVFLHICSFLDSGFLLQSVSLVCKHFYAVLSNEKTWLIRQAKRWGQNGPYPPVGVDEDNYSWSKACWKREEQIKLWGSNGANLRSVELRKHIGCVDSVFLFEAGQFLATGSRDRSIAIWNVEEALNSFQDVETEVATEDNAKSSKSIKVTPTVAPPSAIVHHNPVAHKGWIWAFATNQQHLLSASWDNTVKVWDKHSGFKLVGELSPNRVACLCLAMTEHQIACGTFDKNVLLFDTRAGTYKHVVSHKLHRGCILALGLDDTRIISCSEDGLTILYDLRAQKGVKSIKLQDEAYPTCLSFRRDDPAPLFYLGDRVGRLHLVNSNTFEVVKTYNTGHEKLVQGVFHGLGSVFSCSRDGHFKVFEPSLGLNELATIEIKAELPGVHSFNNTVALAGGDAVVRLWAPKDNF